MWANAQSDGRPAEYRWRPLFNYDAVCLTPTNRVPYSNAAKTRNPLKFAGVPQTNETFSAVIVGRSSPYRKDMWGRYCRLTSFFPIVDTCLSCEDISDKVVPWCADGDFLHHFCVLYFQRAACSTFQTCSAF